MTHVLFSTKSWQLFGKVCRYPSEHESSHERLDEEEPGSSSYGAIRSAGTVIGHLFHTNFVKQKVVHFTCTRKMMRCLTNGRT
jgi:hypothetical protein